MDSGGRIEGREGGGEGEKERERKEERIKFYAWNAVKYAFHSLSSLSPFHLWPHAMRSLPFLRENDKGTGPAV